jgi:uncharacterized membrane-anchored protein
VGSSILVGALCLTLFVWYKTEKTLSVNTITTPRAELFYWVAILFSNTLGTALGDFLADSSGLGFLGGAVLVSTLIGIIVVAKYTTKISSVILFWLAFVLTRPFGATFGDLLTKSTEKGGLGFGTVGSSLVLVTLLSLLILFSVKKNNKKILLLD